MPGYGFAWPVTANRSLIVESKSSEPAPVRSGLVLACMCVCTILVVGFVASINLAVPLLASSNLHPTSAQLLWIVDAYVVFFACLARCFHGERVVIN